MSALRERHYSKRRHYPRLHQRMAEVGIQTAVDLWKKMGESVKYEELRVIVQNGASVERYGGTHYSQPAQRIAEFLERSPDDLFTEVRPGTMPETQEHISEKRPA